MDFLIQSAVFPKESLCSESELYFHGIEKEWLHELEGAIYKIELPEDSILKTDTYFNSFSIGKWIKKTGLSDLKLQLKFSGRIAVRWFLHRTNELFSPIGESEEFCSQNSDGYIGISIPEYELLNDGILSFEIVALTDSTFYDFKYTTQMHPRREVNLGIVITHFNRQPFLIPAVQRLNEQLLKNDYYADHVKLFVVDNSQNLIQEQLTGAQIICNANLGGSGGFMRGLDHILRERGGTHCLFMDDDASTEIESIKRTISFLQYVKEDNSAVAGAMLFDRSPYVQHGSGARFNGGGVSRHSNMDLRDIKNVIGNEVDDPVDYGGWWFFAFPLKYVRNFTFPFFVRGDDIDFCLSNSFEVVTLNGICSWQESFAQKDSPYTAYLDLRSRLVHVFISGTKYSRYGKGYRSIRNAFKTYARTYHYEAAQTILDAVEDVLKGPDFWHENVDMGKRRPEIMARIQCEKMQNLPEKWGENYPLVESPKKKSLLARLTLSGHLLPDFMLCKKEIAALKGYGGRLNETFLRKRVLYVDLVENKGYIVKHDKKAFFKAMLRYYYLQWRFLLNYGRLKKLYQGSQSELRSREFWQKQFDKYNKS